MAILKHEMRSLFEKSKNTSLYGYNCFLDEGITKQIAYFSLLNPKVFPNNPWDITDVRSISSKQKILNLCGSNRCLSEIGNILIICTNQTDKTIFDLNLQLLKISIMYACRQNTVDFEIYDKFNEEALREYFLLNEKSKVAAILILGFFEGSIPNIPYLSKSYEEIVKVI